MNETLSRLFSDVDIASIGEFRKEILGILILLSFTFFFYRFVYMKNTLELREHEGKLNVLKGEITRIRNEIKATEELKRRLVRVSGELRRTEKRLEGLKERLPTEKYISSILNEIAGNDVVDRVRVLSIKPLPPEDKGELLRLPFHVNLESSFIPFGRYLERLEGLKRLMIVDNFRIEARDEESGLLNIQIFLSTYVLGYGK